MLGQQDNGKGYVEVDQITEQVDRDKAILFSLCAHVICSGYSTGCPNNNIIVHVKAKRCLIECMSTKCT
jgi:hypothetical protein